MTDDLTLTLELDLAAPRAAVWRCWTEPDLMVRWFTPAPWTTTEAALDVRPGGHGRAVMRSPEGEAHPTDWVYLEVEPGRRLVSTSAFSQAWRPATEGLKLLSEIELDDLPGGGTRYVARCRHWSVEDRETHEKMGFREGWTAAARQLEAVAAGLPAAEPPPATPLRTCFALQGRAEEAAAFWTGLLPDSRVERVMRRGPGGPVLVVEFTLMGAPYMAMDMGDFPLGHGASIAVLTRDQAETDRLWEALCDGGQPSRCGWLVDRFGVSWQITPAALPRLLAGPGAEAAFEAMLGMGKIDIAGIEAAAAARAA